jgi:hypothetical protein
MATTSRQTAIFGTEDWKKIYKTYKEADLQSYNFETIRKTFIDYLQQHHPESFNDYTESSELIALLDLISFMGQSLSFRNDLNTRENFLDTAERRDSVTNLASLVGYTSKRNEAASGYLKVLSVSTTENVIDYNRNNLSNVAVRWNDKTNDDWQEQFTLVLNAAIINSQRIGQPGQSSTIVGVKTDEYAINLVNGFLPVVPFTAIVDGVSMDFELVNATSVNTGAIYEPAPKRNGTLNVLYRNDNQGFASPNTGYFFYFKQGALETRNFSLSERIANRSEEMTVPGVNNSDVWLFTMDAATGSVADQWTQVENIYASGNTQLAVENRKFFSVTSRTEDNITFNFGDGVFSEIPVGSFRAYMRRSNGAKYVISPEEVQNVSVNFNYISKAGRTETLKLVLGLTVPVTNAKSNETLDDIKRRAPARFYTQNRMVNGEDYNHFPYTSFSSIIKSKAVNRTNIGASRYLDLVDPTGKYSSINAYGSDGVLYRDTNFTTFNFTFNNKNDIDSVFRNRVEPLIASRGTVQFYYENFGRVAIPEDTVFWHQSTTITNQTSGYFMNSGNDPVQLGTYAADARRYLVASALVKFVAPTGYHFTASNKLALGTATAATDKDEIWSTIVAVETDGTNQGLGNHTDGTGPVTINNFVPTGAIPAEIIPLFNSDIPVAIEQEMLAQVELLRDFGVGFDHLTNEWYVIAANNIDTTSDFSLTNARDISNTNNDASWMIKFASTTAGYVVTVRMLHYYFASILETRFFFDDSRQIFDPRSGKVVNDFIRVLKTNSKPGNVNNPLSGDVIMDIIGQSVEPDGYVNDYNVEVSFTDSDNDSIADDPDYFRKLVDLSGSADNHVFFQSTVDFDNLERYLPVASGIVNAEYPTATSIGVVKTEHVAGQLFYAYSDDTVLELVVSGTSRTLAVRTDIIAKVGRNDIHFHYRHNSPETRRINPGSTNIIDIYIVTSGYSDAYGRYVRDITGSVTEPLRPTTDELTVQYSELQNSTMVSDNVVLNSVKFKPLFGSKAATQLQAYIKVVKHPNAVTSDSEVKSRIISSINEYFSIDNWDFGDTFYFSELSSYLHTQLGDIIGSVIITPKDPSKLFGELYEIKSAPSEIFTSAATVDDVVVIGALTASKI